LIGERPTGRPTTPLVDLREKEGGEKQMIGSVDHFLIGTIVFVVVSVLAVMRYTK
jgi:hypothetical protein